MRLSFESFWRQIQDHNRTDSDLTTTTWKHCGHFSNFVFITLVIAFDADAIADFYIAHRNHLHHGYTARRKCLATPAVGFRSKLWQHK